MAIIVTTPNPKGLIATLKSEIEQGHAHTWKYEKHDPAPGEFFTHTAEDDRLVHRAWFGPFATTNAVVFTIFSPKNVEVIDHGVWGVYHGRFVELLLNHGSGDMTDIDVTPQAVINEAKRAPRPTRQAAPLLPVGSNLYDDGEALAKILSRIKL
jgi:hypothetical protein